MCIELEWDDIVLRLCSGCVILDDSPINLIPSRDALFKQVDSESLYSSSFCWSDNPQPMCIDNNSILGSDKFDNVINIRWDVVEV